MITRHIADLLYHHECVIVPGLGGFIKANNPAWILYSTHEFYPPSGSVAFNAGLSVNDGLLANHITSAENTSYREALYEIKVWVDSSLSKLKNEEKVTLEGIGELFLNNSGKIEFTPARQINFNADSFGLPVFRAKPVAAVQEIIPEVQPAVRTNNNSKFRHLVPETLKWAAVLAPFIAFVLWGSIKGNIVDNYIHNYTGMYSWVRSTPGKTVPVSVASVPVQVKEKPVEVVESPAGILADKNIAFNPGIISYYELAKEHIYFIDNETPAGTETPDTKKNEVVISNPYPKLSTNHNLQANAGSSANTDVSHKPSTIPEAGLKANSVSVSVSDTRPASSREKNARSKKHINVPVYPWTKPSIKPNEASDSKAGVETGELIKTTGVNPAPSPKTADIAINNSGTKSKAADLTNPNGNLKTNSAAPAKLSSSTQGFHIIGGAFREHNNALKLIEMLKAKGYSPAIVDTTPGGLYVVSIAGYKTLNEAETKLRDIRKDGYSTSWILKKKKT